MATIEREITGRAEWLAARRTGIGGSDAGAICGVNPYRTAADVWEEKMGWAAELAPTPAMQRGTTLEPIAAELYAQETGRAMRRQPMRRHTVHEWMVGNCDRQIFDAGDGRGTGVLEIKCPGLQTFARIKREGLPEMYVLQLQHYLGVFGYRWGSFALFNAERWELLHFDVEADAELIGRLVEVEGEFWREHVEARVRPDVAPVALPDVPKVEGELVTRGDPEWADAVAMLREAKELSATAGELESAAKARLQALMGDAAVVEGAGARIYWREQAGSKRLDEKAFRAAHPDIDLAAFKVPGAPTRPFRAYFLTSAGADE